MTSNIWSGIVWKDGRRKASNFLFSDVCVLDFDDGQMTLREAQKVFCDQIHILGTTRSHQKEKQGIISDRFRVVIPWERRITDSKEYRYNMEKVVRDYPADSQCVDAARLYFPCKEIVSISDDGYKRSVLDKPPGFGEPPPPVDPSIRGTGYMPRHVRDMLMTPAQPGTIKRTYFVLGAQLSRWGFSLSDAVDLVARGRAGAMATHPDPMAELREHVTRGWRKDRGG